MTTRNEMLRDALNDVVGKMTWRPDNTAVIHDAEAWRTLVGYIVMATNGDNDGQVPMGVAPDPWPMDVERLRDWWDSLSELDQFNAYRIEKSNADALAAPDPAPLAEAVAAERARIYGQLVDRLWGCDADANAVLDIVEDDAAIEGSKE